MATSHDYVATKKELMRLLQQTMTPVIYTRMTAFYNDSIKYAQQNNATAQDVFVALLNEVPNWNAACIEHEEAHVKEKIPQVYGVYKALWLSTLMVISSVRLGAPKDIQTTVRPLRDFIHEIYKEIAQDLAADPGLFDHNVSPAQLRKNRKETLELIVTVIPDALRNLLPMAEIYSALDEDVEGKQVFEEKDSKPDSPASSPEPHDELEDIRREAEKIKHDQPEGTSPRPSYGSPPVTPKPVDPSDDDDESSHCEPEEYGGFTSDHSDDDDDDPYLKDLPIDYDTSHRPEVEDDYLDSEDDH